MIVFMFNILIIKIYILKDSLKLVIIMNSMPFVKIVVIGEGNSNFYEGRVGKTSMSLKFVEDKFDEKQKTTINASYLDKTMTLSSNKDVKLAIWVRI